MNNLETLLTDLFGEYPEPAETPGHYRINYGRTIVSEHNDNELKLTDATGDTVLYLAKDASLRDAEDAMNFVMFAKPGETDLFRIERGILAKLPDAEITHGRENADAPTESFIDTGATTIRLSRDSRGYLLRYWDGVLDVDLVAATVDGAINRAIVMHNFAKNFAAEIAG